MRLLARQVLLATVPLIVLGGATVWIAAPRVRLQADQSAEFRTEAVADRQASLVSRFFQVRTAELRAIAASPLVTDSKTRMEYLGQEERRLLRTNENLRWLSFDGYTHPAHGRAFYVGDRTYYKTASQGKFIISEVFTSRVTGRRVSVIAVPVLDGQNHPIGAVCAAVPVDVLEQTLQPNKDVHLAALYDPAGQLVSVSSRDTDGGSDATAKALSHPSTLGMFRLTHAGTDYVGYFAKVPDMDWHVLCAVNEESILYPVRVTVIEITLAFLLVAGLSIGVSIISLRAGFGPVGQLLNTMARFESGDRVHRAETRGDDELSELAEGFNRLADTLQTERAALEESQSLLLGIIANSGAHISVKDMSGRYILMNDKAKSRLGPDFEPIGRSYEELFPLFAKEYHEHDLMALKARGPLEFEEHFSFRGEECTVLASRFPLFRANGEPYAMGNVSTEITEIRRYQKEILVLNNDLERRVAERTLQLEQTNRDLEAFCYSVSHDLRTPLRSILSFTQILLQDLKRIPDEPADMLRRVENASKRMAQLIDDLLLLSRIGRQAVSRTEVQVDRMASELFAELAATMTFEAPTLVVQADMPVANADVGLARQLLANLLENAIKFSTKQPTSQVWVGAMEGEGETVFYVRDNGVGFDQAEAEKAFRPFERLHNESGIPGTGIGLATTKRIVEAHGGRIWATSEVGHGTTMYFTFSPIFSTVVIQPVALTPR